MSVAEDQLRHDFKKTFGTPEGLRVLSDLARFCNIGFAFGVQSDAQVVFGIECQRKVFWYIYDRVHREVLPKKAPGFDFESKPFERILP